MEGIQQLTVTRSHGRYKVQAIGRTPRGQKFILAEEELKATKITDPNFKAEVEAAAKKLCEREA